MERSTGPFDTNKDKKGNKRASLGTDSSSSKEMDVSSNRDNQTKTARYDMVNTNVQQWKRTSLGEAGKN